MRMPAPWRLADLQATGFGAFDADREGAPAALVTAAFRHPDGRLNIRTITLRTSSPRTRLLGSGRAATR